MPGGYTLCPDDGCMIVDGPVHDLFHERLAQPIADLEELKVMAEQLAAPMAQLANLVATTEQLAGQIQQLAGQIQQVQADLTTHIEGSA